MDQRCNLEGVFDFQGSSLSAVPSPVPLCKHALDSSATTALLSVLATLVDTSGSNCVCAVPHFHSHTGLRRRVIAICRMLCVQLEQTLRGGRILE